MEQEILFLIKHNCPFNDKLLCYLTDHCMRHADILKSFHDNLTTKELDYLIEIDTSELIKFKMVILFDKILHTNKAIYTKKYLLSLKEISNEHVDILCKYYFTIPDSNFNIFDEFIFSDEIKNKCTYDVYFKLAHFIISLDWLSYPNPFIIFLYELDKNILKSVSLNEKIKDYIMTCSSEHKIYDKLAYVITNYCEPDSLLNLMIRFASILEHKNIEKYVNKLISNTPLHTENGVLTRLIYLCCMHDYKISDCDGKTLLHFYNGVSNIAYELTDINQVIRILENKDSEHSKECLMILLKKKYCFNNSITYSLIIHLVRKYKIAIDIDMLLELSVSNRYETINKYSKYLSSYIDQEITSNNILSEASDLDITYMLNSIETHRKYYDNIKKEAEKRKIEIKNH